jgi:hypothetical protein
MQEGKGQHYHSASQDDSGAATLSEGEFSAARFPTESSGTTRSPPALLVSQPHRHEAERSSDTRIVGTLFPVLEHSASGKLPPAHMSWNG